MDTGTPASDYDYDFVIDVVGFMAGLFVSVALLPQIYRAHKRKSAKDLSLFWQGTVIVGLTMQLFFLRYNRLWSVFVPVLGELVLIVYLTGLKIRFDGVDGSRAGPRPPAAEGALITPSGGGGDGKMFINDHPEEESGERVFAFPGSSAQALEPLLGDEGQGLPEEGGESPDSVR